MTGYVGDFCARFIQQLHKNTIIIIDRFVCTQIERQRHLFAKAKAFAFRQIDCQQAQRFTVTVGNANRFCAREERQRPAPADCS